MRNKKEVLIKCAPRFNQHFLKAYLREGCRYVRLTRAKSSALVTAVHTGLP